MPPSDARLVQVPVEWANHLHHHRIKFDQCRLGQMVIKATTLSTDLPLHHWQDLRCNHLGHQPLGDLQSSDLSRYPDQMMLGLAQAIAKVLQVPPKPGAPTNPPELRTNPLLPRGLERRARRTQLHPVPARQPVLSQAPPRAAPPPMLSPPIPR